MVSTDLINKLKSFAEKEYAYAEKLASLASKVTHPALKAIFMGIASDSRKHGKFYEAIVTILTTQYPLLSQEKLDEIGSAVREHINTEAEMIKFTEELIKEVDDPKAKMLLSAIHLDELAHHKVLVSIEDKVAKALTLTEDELWDMIWKESLWHGAPGG